MTSDNLARYELVSLKLVVLCATSGTLSAAARKANLSLSGASHRLTEFEKTLGRRLFRRRYRGLEPTAAGWVVVRHGETILSSLEALRVGVQSAADEGACLG